MIITKTPLRISFCGGGTDIQSYYKENSYGAVISATINKYIYIMINKKFNDSIKVSYSITENVQDIEELRHDIVKECLRMVGITKGIEIVSVADIPSGTGLGSSSAFTVGLLNGLYNYIGKSLTPHELAEKACEIEIDILKNPIGKQDQFAAAYGGINYFRFNDDEKVIRKEVQLSKQMREQLNSNLSMFFTGISRNASAVLGEQGKNATQNIDDLLFLREQADWLYNNINQKIVIGEMLNETWERKRNLAKNISNENINNIYDQILELGASGGKLLGAGGGGFLLIYADENVKKRIEQEMKLSNLEFSFSDEGSKVISCYE